MNDVFGEENFVANIIWQKKYSPQNDAKWFSNMHDHIICYSKNKEAWRPNLFERTVIQNARYSNPDNDKRGNWKSSDFSVKTYSANYDYPITTPSGRIVNPPPSRCWRTSKENFEKLVIDNRIWFGPNNSNVPSIKRFLTEVKQGITPSTIWFREDVGDNQEAAKDIRNLFVIPPFDTPKPVRLLNRIIGLGSKSTDLILDFFSGSGTTAHAVMQLNSEDDGNRKCISVQLPELTDEKSEAHKAGYKTIADIAKERIRRAGKKIEAEINQKIKDKKKEIQKIKEQLDLDGKDEKISKIETEIKKLKHQDLGFKVLKLSDSNFKQWQQIKGNNAEALDEQMKLFIDPVSKNATTKNMVYELMLKSGKSLNSKLEHKKNYYCINDNELIFLLEKATPEIIDEVIKEKPQKVVALDRLFKDNDQLKTNTSLQMRDAEIEFKTI